MYAQFFSRLTLAFVLAQLAGCAEPIIRDSRVMDYRVSPPPARPDEKPSHDARGVGFEVGRATVSPPNVSPGGSLVLRVPYSLSTPNAGIGVKITETHVLIIEGEPVELRRQQLVRTHGQHNATAKVTLPDTLSTGSYALITTISDGKITKTAKTTVIVK